MSTGWTVSQAPATTPDWRSVGLDDMLRARQFLRIEIEKEPVPGARFLVRDCERSSVEADCR